MSFQCNKCFKDFKSKYNLSKHKNKKIPCNQVKEELKCNICDIKLRTHYDKINHEKTAKHIKNVTIRGNNNTVNIDSYNNIIQLTLTTNPFKETNLNCVDYEMLESIYEKYHKNSHSEERVQMVVNLRSISYLLEKIHFDLRNSSNQNLKILLLFPNLEKKIVEYMILEINPDTKEISWQRLEFHEFIDKLIELLEKLNERHQVDNFVKYINYMKIMLRNEQNKESIENHLCYLYKSYNKNQKKENRKEGNDLNENIELYKEYRQQELKLPNGFLPIINNSLI